MQYMILIFRGFHVLASFEYSLIYNLLFCSVVDMVIPVNAYRYLKLAEDYLGVQGYTAHKHEERRPDFKCHSKTYDSYQGKMAIRV